MERPKDGMLNSTTADICRGLGCRLLRDYQGPDCNGSSCSVKSELANSRPLWIAQENWGSRIPENCPNCYRRGMD